VATHPRDAHGYFINLFNKDLIKIIVNKKSEATTLLYSDPNSSIGALKKG
jgi:hypothetical protein